MDEVSDSTRSQNERENRLDADYLDIEAKRAEQSVLLIEERDPRWMKLETNYIKHKTEKHLGSACDIGDKQKNVEESMLASKQNLDGAIIISSKKSKNMC